ncbi:glycosyltransferase family 2 protein [Salinibacter ruber]|uniref:glycosyltransferase family 2 protein n=1 Tax=Salinibacter ruber TaxID=146919 RepID=UPI00216873EE|nr:glycosyltransferase family 2 protein [Salinibacter ruber]MCS3697418.1 hypothetical protein [Salinibacter ruber]
MNCETPILLLIFNRPDHTAQVLEQIREVKPPLLFVGADGPRPDNPDDAEQCEQAREVATRVDWDCEVHTLFRDENLGCKKAVSSAITWFFDHIEEGIILEDDCVPDPSFFPYCECLLQEYRGDARVSMVSGQNPLGTWGENESSYHFSNFGGIWGWATWSDMWQMYEIDDEAKGPQFVRKVLGGALGDKVQSIVRSRGVERVLSKNLDSWDYKWFYARLLNHTVSAVPSCNLVSNIGFGKEATHTTQANGRGSRQDLGSLEFPLTHPIGVFPDQEYDREWFERTSGYESGSLVGTLRRKKIIIEHALQEK